jgi:uncharacterized small protein (DUF1192 family)
VAVAPLRWVGTILTLAHKVQALLESHEKTTITISRLNDEIRMLKVEIERLKAREEVVVARAEAAASTAAGSVAMHATARLSQASLSRPEA